MKSRLIIYKFPQNRIKERGPSQKKPFSELAMFAPIRHPCAQFGAACATQKAALRLIPHAANFCYDDKKND
jgi:hypothetical protein